MNAIPVVVAGLALYFLGYKFYAKYLSEKIFKLDPNAPDSYLTGSKMGFLRKKTGSCSPL
jgi:hypothetical protein